MPAETILRNARVVLPHEVMTGHVAVRDGLIAEIGEGAARIGEDLEGDLLIPGLVELHTDHIEGHYIPRPKVYWEKTAALQAHDAQIAASGITTVFDALRVGTDESGLLTSDDMREMASVIERSVAEDRLRADHYVHLRCEVSAADAVEGFEKFETYPRLRLVSLMDHAPGQRQFVDLDAYRVYYQKKLNLSDGEFASFGARRLAESQEFAQPSRTAIAARCRGRGIAVASHDDADLEHVAEAVALGTTLAEFPTTLAAATASREAGMKVLMGAPNIVRGGSHSGNLSAIDLHRRRALDILSSDYVPFSLLQAAFALAETETRLPDAIRLVTRNPAEAVGLTDRGEILAGRRADLVRVRPDRGRPPVVRSVWREGRRVA